MLKNKCRGFVLLVPRQLSVSCPALGACGDWSVGVVQWAADCF